MNIYTVRLITFSPTHTSKQVGEAIVRGTGISDVARTDLTFHPAGKLEIPESTLTVITVSKKQTLSKKKNSFTRYLTNKPLLEQPRK